MAHIDWAVAADVTNLLASLTEPITIPNTFDLTSYVAAAVDEVNRITRYTPFFNKTGATLAVAFDPPGPDTRGTIRGGGYRLQLQNGLLSLTSLFAGVNPATGETGDQLTSGLDFYLGPSDAPQLGKPWTKVDFIMPQRGTPQSIVVTGAWGYCQTNIPDLAWLGHLELSAAKVLNALREGLLTGAVRVKDDDVEKALDPKNLASVGDALMKSATSCLSPFRLLT